MNNKYRDYSKYQYIWKKNFVLKKILNRFKLLPHKSVICKGPGFKILIRHPFDSVVGRVIFLSGIWEKETTAVVKEKVQSGWNILDVGADIGYYSILFSNKCGPKGLVASFEPDPDPWPILKYNIDTFGLSNISSYAVALSDHRGKGMMRKDGRGQLYPDEIGTKENTSTVNLITLEEIWPTIAWNHLDLVKIDVEGGELAVLLGMEKILKKYHPHLLIEIHPSRLKKIFNTSTEELIKFLTEKYPYKLTPVDTKTLDVKRESNFTVWCDWIETNDKQ